MNAAQVNPNEVEFGDALETYPGVSHEIVESLFL